MKLINTIFFTFLLCLGMAQGQVTVTLIPSQDNTLFQEENNLSNGSGQYIFAGATAAKNNNALRRALLRFDLAANVPANATINSVSLTLNMNKSIVGEEPMTLHRVTSDWGEGGTNASGAEGGGGTASGGDATWAHAFFDTVNWVTAGGDFVSNPSATQTVSNAGNYSWTSEEMVADVQAWLAQPDSNFGWILLGDETGGTSAKRFDSREAANEEDRPTLQITYSVTSSIASALDQVEIYPNPTTQDLQIKGLAGPILVELHQLDGRRVFSQSLNNNQRHISLSDLPSGYYIIKVQNQEGAVVKSVIKE